MLDTPHHAVAIVELRIVGCEMERDQRGERPIEKPCWQLVMLREGEPLPFGSVAPELGAGVLPEIAQQVTFECSFLYATQGKPYESGEQAPLAHSRPPENIGGAVPANGRVPCVPV